jgi:hypothetical protein
MGGERAIELDKSRIKGTSCLAPLVLFSRDEDARSGVDGSCNEWSGLMGP